jgi:hypothetical protein
MKIGENIKKKKKKRERENYRRESRGCTWCEFLVAFGVGVEA